MPLCETKTPPVVTILRPAKSKRPEVPLVPLPVAIITEPPRPEVETPLPSKATLLLPPTALPELNEIRPPSPVVPALLVRTITVPLLDMVPSELAKQTALPVLTACLPAAIEMRPPELLVPLPTKMFTLPPRPCVDAPEARLSAPLLPAAAAAPELKMSSPLAPLALPAFMEATRSTPLVAAVPSPTARQRRPPVFMVVQPA